MMGDSYLYWDTGTRCLDFGGQGPDSEEPVVCVQEDGGLVTGLEKTFRSIAHGCGKRVSTWTRTLIQN